MNTVENITSSKEMLANETDAEFKEMAKMEIDELSKKQVELEDKIKVLLIPKDEEDAKNAVMEIRAGTGGDEASIFVGDLFRMYSKYCDKKGWKIEIVDTSHGTSGGYKEIVFNISGADVYGILKYESGVHRVQRVPQTETQGRVHTSAVAIIVLPEAEEFDIDVKDSDLKVDSFCSSGPGGQSVNTTYSAIRITHLPTGVVAQCQDQKSKLKNYDKALSVLRSRIYEIELQKKLEADAEQRKNLVSSSDRSAKIRTYNYSQGRVTDHRINLTLYNLSGIIDGDVDVVIQPLRAHDNAEKLKFSEAV
jgi:peptide chain release factor 1